MTYKRFSSALSYKLINVHIFNILFKITRFKYTNIGSIVSSCFYVIKNINF